MEIVKNDLTGLRVLILEDDGLLSMLLEDMVTSLGCEAAGIFTRVAETMDYIKSSAYAIDVAILDVNVAGEESFPIADLLTARGIPFAFSTGYGELKQDIWRNALQLGKPFTVAQLEIVLNELLLRKKSVERV